MDAEFYKYNIIADIEDKTILLKLTFETPQEYKKYLKIKDELTVVEEFNVEGKEGKITAIIRIDRMC